MKKIFQKQRELLAVIIYVGFILAIIYFIIMPLLSRINSVQDQIQEEKINQEIKEQSLADLPKMQEQYENLQNNEKMIDVLFDKNNAVELIEKLEKLAQDSGNVITISVQEKEPAKDVSSKARKKTNDTEEKKPVSIVENLPSSEYMQIKLELKGGFDTAVNFIHKLENFEYYCDIIGIKMQQAEKGDKKISNTESFGSININSVENPEGLLENISSNNVVTTIDVVFYTK
ncbi:MAG TPA: hypothetical protein PLB52_01845 [Candidatus Moranbacteria bacterium]|nr:hypothetical protein [Candidatus Moranbacteria bacterium]